MCFNAAYTKREQELSNILGIDESVIPDLPIYYQISGFSHPDWPLLLMDNPKEIILGKWGLIPHWAKKDEQIKKIKNSTLNARSETLHEKPSFKTSFRNKRCIIPVDGFYEPYKYGKKSYPCYCFHPEKPLLFLAGLYSRTSAGITFSIVTVPARGLLAEVHNSKLRMPCIFKKEHINLWLKSDMGKESLQNLMSDSLVEGMEAYTVSPLIYDRKSNSNVPVAREPYRYEELSLLANGLKPWENP